MLLAGSAADFASRRMILKLHPIGTACLHRLRNLLEAAAALCHVPMIART
jgi:hypothetical protein